MLPSWYWFAIGIQVFCWLSPVYYAAVSRPQPYVYDSDLKRDVPLFALYSFRMAGLSFGFALCEIVVELTLMLLKG